MLTSHLVLAALDRQDTVAIVLASTGPEKPPSIAEASDPFHRLSGFSRDQVAGLKLTALASPGSETPDWKRLLAAIASGTPVRGEVCCAAPGRNPFWLGYGLTHAQDPMTGRTHPVLIARDITADRRAHQGQLSTQALLGSMVMKADAAVALLKDGRISMANPAMRTLTGFSTAELAGKFLRDLTHPEDRRQVGIMEGPQCTGGQTYRLGIRIVTKEGRAVPVRLASVLVDHSDLDKFRVVTLLPDGRIMPVAEPTRPLAPGSGAAGRLETLSLDAIREAVGDAWEAISARLLLTAEQVIKRLIRPGDVFARSASSGFVIWFNDGDEEAAAIRLAAIAREVRIRLLIEFGDNGLGEVTAVAAAVPRDGAAAPTVEQLGQHDATLRDRQGLIRAEARDLVSTMSTSPPLHCVRVVGRDGQPAGLTWADLPRDARARLERARASLPGATLAELGAASRSELLALRSAVQGIDRDIAEGRPGNWLLPIGCDAMASNSRRDQLVEALRTTPAPLRKRMVGLLSDVPADMNEAKIRGWYDLIGHFLPSVGAASAAPGLVPRRAMAPSCSLLAIDLEAGLAPDEEAAFEFAGTARAMKLPLLVRVATASEMADWRELGATLFAITANSW